MVELAASPQCELSFLGLLNCRSAVALKNQGQTIGALTAVLGTSAATFVVQILIFSILRQKLPDLYEPKACHKVDGSRLHLISHHSFGWIRASVTARWQTQSLDSYFFLRYLRMLLVIFAPAAIIAVPILAPLNFSSGNQQKGLDRLSISNISPDDSTRLWAHVATATTFVVWTIYNAFREFDHYVRTRQAARMLPHRNQSASATTCLISNIPKEMQNSDILRRLCASFPGGVKHVWINRDLRVLSKAVDQRMEVVEALEPAETRLIRLCWRKHDQKLRADAAKENSFFAEDASPPRNSVWRTLAPWRRRRQHQTVASSVAVSCTESFESHLNKGGWMVDSREGWSTACRGSDRDEMTISPGNIQSPAQEPVRTDVSGAVSSNANISTGSMINRQDSDAAPTGISLNTESQRQSTLWRQYLRDCDRETIRILPAGLRWLPALPPFGKAVDMIEHLRGELIRLNSEIAMHRKNAETAPCLNSAFIQFEGAEAAQMCCQSVLSQRPQQMTPRLCDIDPRDLCWENLSVHWREQYIRWGAVFLLCAVLVPLYAVPIAFTSLMNKIVWLAGNATWLTWLAHSPEWTLVALQGILPPLMLGIILAVVPMMFRFLVKRLRLTTTSAEEVSVQRWYFTFLFVQIFFVVTISGGVTESLAELATNPSGLVRSLATNLPKAANYFLSYITVQALSQSASTLLRYSSLLIRAVIGLRTDATPRQKLRRRTDLCSIQWGSQYPPITNIASIAIIYTITSPIVALFVVPTIGMFWIAYRYNIVHVYQNQTDGSGESFPVGINQLFTGVYFMELCLAAFLLTLTSGGRLLCLPQALVMCLVLIGTVVSQVVLASTYEPLLHYLPLQISTGLQHDKETKPSPRIDTLHLGGDGSRAPRCGFRTLISRCWQSVLRCISAADGSSMTTLSLERSCYCLRASSLPTYQTNGMHLRKCSRCENMSFGHHVLHPKPPTVWLPRDSLGVSADEIGYLRTPSIEKGDGEELNQQEFSNIGAHIDSEGNVSLTPACHM